MSPNAMEEGIAEAARDLQTPAGNADEFSSPEKIIENRREFVLHCHRTWKRLHLASLKELFLWEGWLRREKAHPIGPPAVEFAEYNRVVWRRINDAIIWSVFGVERHVVKRFCLYKPRLELLQSNPDSVYAALEAFNAEPMSLAIWNDATSIVDIADLTYIKDGLSPMPEFIELKAGEVNAEILELLKLKGNEFSSKFKEFAEKRSKHGIAQFERIIRQHKTGEQAIDLLHKERGTDPVTGVETRIVDIPVVQDTYDQELDEVLRKAVAQHSEVIQLVGGCVWVYASADPKVDRNQASLRFLNFLSTQISGSHFAGIQKPGSQDRDRIVSLRGAFHQPVAKPIFLRALDPLAIASTIYGDLAFKTFLYIDWQRFSNLCAECGVEFVWTDGKAMRRARSMQASLRPPLISGRLAQIKVQEAVMTMTDPSLVQILFDGTTSLTVIKNMIAHAEILQREGRSGR
jgi:hypothetical protein